MENESGIWLRLKQNFLEGNTLLAIFSGKVMDPVMLTLEHSLTTGLASPQPPSEFSFQTELGGVISQEAKTLLENAVKPLQVSASSLIVEDHWYAVLDTQQPHEGLRLLKLKSSLGALAPLPKTRYFVSNQDNLPEALEQKI